MFDGESLSHRIARELEPLNPHIHPWELEILIPCDQIRRYEPAHHAGFLSSLPETRMSDSRRARLEPVVRKIHNCAKALAKLIAIDIENSAVGM